MLEPIVTFAAGNSRSFRSDARLHLEVLTPDCATASTSPASLSILTNASCTEVVVFASLPELTELAGVASAHTTLLNLALETDRQPIYDLSPMPPKPRSIRPSVSPSLTSPPSPSPGRHARQSRRSRSFSAPLAAVAPIRRPSCALLQRCARESP